MNTISIASHPLAEYKIVCGSSQAEQYAAAELKSYFEKITGDPFFNNGDRCIRLSIDPTIAHDPETYAVSVTAESMSVTGSGPRGVIYGVYDILERFLNVRFLTPTLEKLGNGGDIPVGDYSFTPHMNYRQSDYPLAMSAEWCVKNRINFSSRCSIPNEMGGVFTRGNSGCHTFEAFTGVPQNQQPCLSDPEVLRKGIEYTRNLLRKNPNVQLINISQNDTKLYCTCEKCAAVDAEEGSPMGSIMRLVNAIADDIRDDYPHVSIETLAYQYSTKPCKTPPRPNVVVRLCSIRCCFVHPLSDTTCPHNVTFNDEILGWNKICNNLTVWDYAQDFSHYVPPYPNLGVLRENMHFFASHGVHGMYPEGPYNARGSGEFFDLRAYLLAKLMWDPFMSESQYYEHMNEFLEAYYGNGWRYIRFFIDWLTSEAKDMHARFYWKPYEIIPEDRYAAAAETLDFWWDKAEELAGDKLENVQRSRTQWTHIKLMLTPDPIEGEKLYNQIVKWNIRWRENSELPNDPYDFADSPIDWFNDGPLPWLTAEELQHQEDVKRIRAEREAKKKQH